MEQLKNKKSAKEKLEQKNSGYDIAFDLFNSLLVYYGQRYSNFSDEKEEK